MPVCRNSRFHNRRFFEYGPLRCHISRFEFHRLTTRMGPLGTVGQRIDGDALLIYFAAPSLTDQNMIRCGKTLQLSRRRFSRRRYAYNTVAVARAFARR